MAFIPGIVIFSELNSIGISLKFSQYVNSLNKSLPSPQALRNQTLTVQMVQKPNGMGMLPVSNSRRQGWSRGKPRAEHAAAIGSCGAESGGSQAGKDSGVGEGGQAVSAAGEAGLGRPQPP